MDTISMMEVKSGDSEARQVTELFNQLQQDTISYTESEHNFRTYFDSESGEPRLRSDLSPSDLLQLVQGIQEVRVRIGVENEVNAAALAGEADSINLFSATDASSVQTERVALIETVQELEAQLRETFGESGIPLLEVIREEGGVAVESIPLDQAFALANAERATDLAARMHAVAERRDAFVKAQARRGAIIAGSISAVGGVGSALAAEAISHGAYPTMFDSFRPRTSADALTPAPKGAPIQETSGKVSVEYAKVGAADVEILKNGKQIEVTLPSGETNTFDLSGKGQLDPEDVKYLKSQGVEVTQTVETTATTRNVGVNSLLKAHGAKQMEVDSWLINGTTRPDGTELAGQVTITKSGNVVISHDGGIATGGGKRYDILAEAKKGNLSAYLTNRGLTVEVPLSVNSKGDIVSVLPKSSELSKLFTRQPDGSIQYQGSMWRIGIPNGSNSYDSVASSRGVADSVIKIPVTKTAIQLQFEQSATGEAQSVGYTIPGVAFSPDSGQLYAANQKQKEQPSGGPDGPRTVAGGQERSLEEQRQNRGELGRATERREIGSSGRAREVSGGQERKAITPAQPERVTRDALKVVPLSPDEIIDRLTASVPRDLVIEISGQPVRVNGVELSSGAPRLTLIAADGKPDFITLESLRDALADGKVRFNKYLGTNDASALAKDVREGEVFYDTELGKNIRVTRTYENGNVAYEELDENGEQLPREADSNPRAILAPSLVFRLQNGSLVPGSHRGVELA
jgi:hypothetical protein